MIPYFFGAAASAAFAGPALWTPAALPNAKAWFVSDNPENTVVDGLTTALADKGGAGFTATAAREGAAMTDSLNGRPVLRTGGGAGVFMSTAAGDAIGRVAGGVSIFAVHRAISKDGADYPAVGSTSFGAGTSTLQVAMMRSQVGHNAGTINLRTRPGNGVSGMELSDDTNYDTSWIVAGGARRFNHDDGTLWINGTQTASAVMDSDGVTQDIDMSVMVGSYTAENGVDYWTQNIAEIVFLRDDFPDADRVRLEGYLAWQWGLQGILADGHPYKASAPTV